MIMSDYVIEGFPSSILEHATGAVAVIDNDHKYIHKGQLFESFVKTTILAGGTYIVAIKTPLDKELHYRPSGISPSADKVTVELLEGGTYTGGTDIPVINHKRSGGLSATQAVKGGVTVSAAGTLITQVFLPGSTGVGQSITGGAFSGATNEWILEKDTVYLYRIANGSAESNTVQVNFFWYEEDEIS